MKKILSFILVLVLSLSLFAGCSNGGNSNSTPTTGGSKTDADSSATKATGQLNLFTWAGMFSTDFIAGFEKETGVTVNYINFDTDETMFTKLKNAGGGEYDLVIADDYIIETVISEGLAQKLDKEKLYNLKNINPLYQGQFFDKDDEYTVPNGAGVQSIVYNPESVDIEITKYADLWDSTLKGKVGVIGNPRVITGAALKVLGESYNTEEIAKIEEAGQKLIALAPNIRLVKDVNIQDDLISGEIDVSIMYTSQVTKAKEANPNLKIVFPEEGIGFGIMAGFLPSKAPNPNAAYAFLNYVLDAKRAAKFFEEFGYYTTNLASEEFIPEDMLDILTLPKSFKKEDMEMIQNIRDEALDVHTKVWNEFLAATS